MEIAKDIKIEGKEMDSDRECFETCSIVHNALEILILFFYPILILSVLETSEAWCKGLCWLLRYTIGHVIHVFSARILGIYSNFKQTHEKSKYT